MKDYNRFNRARAAWIECDEVHIVVPSLCTFRVIRERTQTLALITTRIGGGLLRTEDARRYE